MALRQRKPRPASRPSINELEDDQSALEFKEAVFVEDGIDGCPEDDDSVGSVNESEELEASVNQYISQDSGQYTSQVNGNAIDGINGNSVDESKVKELPSYQLPPSPFTPIAILLLIAATFIPIGILALRASRSVVEIKLRYDDDCIPPAYKGQEIQFIQGPENKTCVKNMTVPKFMKAPVFVYYELHNFFQNHKRYVRSRSDAQLIDPKNENKIGSCGDDDFSKSDVVPVVPCGLIAWSLFNDTYVFARNNKSIEVNKTGISWKSDRDKFSSNVFSKHFQEGKTIGGGKLDPIKSLRDQENLIVWMRTAPFSTFRKLYGKIEEDLNAGDSIEVTLENNYNTYSFSGKKKLVLSTTSWLGGKNDFMGIAYLTVGGLCFILALAFTVFNLLKPRKLGDPSYLSWNKSPSGH
ncbi:Ala-interacting subunit [Thalictrum thalictroides]|uniref:Ala-interacting subunit n=1 Tax=Thalictrum thalictroides TaxID=46969 RepID=A0A7J6V0I5_THATH|nr:Ala-interacting subunit [Thalictrum thalictroides]